MITGLFQAVGLVLFIAGCLFLLRAYGLVNRNSPFVKYQKAIGFPLLVVGGIILFSSLVL